MNQINALLLNTRCKCFVMKPRRSKEIPRPKSESTKTLPHGLFSGLHAIFIGLGVSRKRLQVWEKRFEDLGGIIITSKSNLFDKEDDILVLAAHKNAISKGFNPERLGCSTKLNFVHFMWVEECLKNGRRLSYEPYSLLTSQDHHFLTTDDEKLCTQSNSGPDHCSTAPALVNTAIDEDLIITTNVVHKKPNDEVTEECKGYTTLNVIWGYDTPDLNKHVSGPLLEMSEIYSDVFADGWRALTYRKVAKQLDKLPYRVSNADELKNIQGIGKSMIDKIKEILCTGQLQKLVNLKASSQGRFEGVFRYRNTLAELKRRWYISPLVQVVVQTMLLFASVWGIGPRLSQRLYQAGHRSLEDLSDDQSLPSMARVGLKYHHDISLRIPNSEVTDAASFVREVLENMCPGALMTVGGSYRRGQATCGDIDVLITHPDGHRLQELEFLVTFPRPRTESGTHIVDTYLGLCKHPQYSHYRRIDIKIYPKHAYAFALVYFTGNDVLNRRIRYLARRKGYKLSDQGLFPRVGNHRDGKASNVPIPCETEEEIFEKLGLAYPEPHDRNW